jgi:hypothetical protein
MNNVRKFLVGLAALTLVFSTASCGLMHDLFDDKVVTTADNVKDERKAEAVKAPTEGVIPAEQVKKMEEAGKAPVIVPKDAVKDSTKAVEITSPGEEGLGNALTVAISILSALFPGIAGLEALGLLFSQRKRRHYADAVKAIVPYDGQVAVGEAVASVAKAMGFAHSSESSKTAYTTETTKQA